MRAAPRRRGILAASLLALLASGCAREPSEDPSAEPPYLSGAITAVDGAEIRVEAHPTGGAAAAVLRLTPDTRIQWSTGEPASRRDLRLGAQVSVWVVGPVAESYPVQATARRVRIETVGSPVDPQA